MINGSLFVGESVRLASPDVERDAPLISAWTHDLGYSKRFRSDLARPLAAFEVKKFLTDQLKQSDESRNVFTYSVRKKSDDRLLGTAWIDSIAWSNRNARISIYLGDPEAGRGEWLESTKMITRFAFHELGLHRLAVMVFEDETLISGVLGEAGFVLEVRQREAAFQNGKYADIILYGILYPDWCSVERIQQ